MRNVLTVVVTLLVLVACSNADTITAVYNGPLDGRTSVSYSIDGGTNFKTAPAGRFNFTVTAIADTATGIENADYFEVGDTFTTYCIDINQRLQSTETYTLAALPDAPANAPMSTEKAKHLAWFLQEVPDINVEAAYQLAIWEIINETSGTYNLTDGLFQAGYASLDSDIPTAWFDALNTAIAAGISDDVLNDVVALTSDNRQDFAVLVPGGGVPEPATMSVLAIGAAGMLIRRKRRTA